MTAELGRASPFSSVVAANGHGISDGFRGELLVNFDRGSPVGDADCRRWVWSRVGRTPERHAGGLRRCGCWDATSTPVTSATGAARMLSGRSGPGGGGRAEG